MTMSVPEYSDEFREKLKDRISDLTEDAHAMIGAIIKKNGVKYSKNTHSMMIYFDRKHVSDKVIDDIKKFVDKCYEEGRYLQSNNIQEMRERIKSYASASETSSGT